MRPQVLFPLFAGAATLPGVGPRVAKNLEKLGATRVVDLLWRLPTGVIDRRYTPKLAEAEIGRVATLTVHVLSHHPPSGSRRPYRVLCSDDSAALTLVFFHGRKDYLQQVLPVGAVRVVSGAVEAFNNALQMTHPDHIAAPEEATALAVVEPVYPLTAGLAPKTLRKVVAAALERAPDLAEWQDAEWLRRRGWEPWRAALARAHAPDSAADLAPEAPARMRLAFDELLATQLALALVRRRHRRRAGRPIVGDGALRQSVIKALPFTLTGAQTRAVAEIAADMASPNRMLRLLQGDVGSGKTVVALLAMLVAAESGGQAAMMAPTEILARQHHAVIAPLAAAAGLEIALLTGRDKGKARQVKLDALAGGDIKLLVGTHALFQADVAFKDLRLAVMDEQHRFGVHQRMLLAGKGRGVDVLVMTATPIPRTLALAAYGDLDQSRLDEKPAGRLPVTTRALPLTRLDEVVAAVGRALDGGAKAYWVCPLVEESDEIDVAAAEARSDALRGIFGAERVGLVHGRMKAADRDAVMTRFAETEPGAGGVDVLAATTVIEVGVDVPAATIMVIEHAERFGLAQLHQLRGRIGRGAGASACLLLYAPPLGEAARARLEIVRETEDGFRIAEEDLRLRGGGEVLGVRQSGLPKFHIADLTAHADLLAAARDDARLIVERDPELTSERGEALRALLYLFDRDAAARTLNSG